MRRGYSGFNRDFFNELRGITQEDVALAKENVSVPVRGAVRVHQLYVLRRVSIKFLDTCNEVFWYLQHNRSPRGLIYHFDPDFKVHPNHIFNFSSGRSYRGQFNIGFSANADGSEDGARIGLGFKLAANFEPDGAEDYWLGFRNAIRNNQQGFQELFERHSDMDGGENEITAENILTVDPRWEDDWIFFGDYLQYSDDEDRELLEDFNKFMSRCLQVFDEFDECLQPYLNLR